MQKAGFLSSCNGIGRKFSNGSQLDKFILTRKNNLPELIFNQNSGQDLNNKQRFFEIDHSQQWRLSDNNSTHKDGCYLCNKHQYTIIFYKRNKVGETQHKNKELVEIKDEDFVQKLHSEYLLRYSQDTGTMKKMTTPLIFGTVVKDANSKKYKRFGSTEGITNVSFIRKLRMMRADIFTLLSVSTSNDFMQR